MTWITIPEETWSRFAKDRRTRGAVAAADLVLDQLDMDGVVELARRLGFRSGAEMIDEVGKYRRTVLP